MDGEDSDRDKTIALHAADERKPCKLASLGNEAWATNSTRRSKPAYDRGQRSRSTPGELELAGRHKTLLCSCVAKSGCKRAQKS